MPTPKTYIYCAQIFKTFFKGFIMPLYDFYCEKCTKSFEEISSADETPPCPHCGANDAKRELSAPSPLKTGAFPYKVGPVHPMMKRKASPNCGGSPCGGGFA